MRKILLTVFILFIGLFLSSCFIGAGSDKTSAWKKTTKIPEVKSTNTPSRTIQSSGRGKVLTNTIEGMTEGVPGVLNAAGVVLAIIDAISNNDKKKTYTPYKTTKKFIPKTTDTSNSQITEQEKITVQDDKKKIKSYIKMSEW